MTTLLERDRELDVLESFVERVRAGHGGRLLITGPAGIGKTALVDAAGDFARARGMQWLASRGSEVAAQVGFAVTRAGFGRFWPEDSGRGGPLAATPPNAAAMLTRAAAAILDLADAVPVLIAVDDVHWADPTSLRLLARLAERASAARIGLLLATRAEVLGTHSPPLAELLDERDAVVLRPAPLSESGAVQLLTGWIEGGVSPELGARCHEQTGGNPYLLGALADALRQSGAAGERLSAARLREIGTRTVSGNVARRLASLRPIERSLLETVAVAGELGGLPALVELLALAPHEAYLAAHRLVELDLLRRADPPELTHPLVGAAVREQVKPQARFALLRRSADWLGEQGLLEQAAARLLELPPAGDPLVADTLARAAALAAARGATEVAATLLRRALTEPPADGRRAEIGASLGQMLLALGEPEAVGVLEQALAAASSPRQSGEIAASLAAALNYARRFEESVAVLERARSALTAAEADLDEELEALAVHQMTFVPGLVRLRGRQLARLGDRRHASEFAYRWRLAELATESLTGCGKATQTAVLAERSLAGGALLSRGMQAHSKAVLSLAYVGRTETARAHLHDAAAHARAAGDAVALGFAIAMHGEVSRLEGEMLRAEIDTRTGLELLPPGEVGPRFILRALIESLVCQGRVDEAEGLLRDGDLAGELPEIMPTPGLLHARAQARIAAGSLVLGLEDLLLAGEIAERFGLRDPVSAPWRVTATEALLELGDHDRAAALAAEQLDLARACGVPEAIGVALRIGGRVRGGPAGRALLEESVGLLERGFARLELARALVDLGQALTGENRAQARQLLERGARLAEQLGAAALAGRAGELATQAGSRPRRARRHGPAALSTAESRTARLAAEGLTNREIAEALVLSEKTIESQLRAAYRKLGIRARGELPVALGASRGPEPLSTRTP